MVMYTMEFLWSIACLEIAALADQYQKSLLTPDDGCQYDSVIEINLDTVSLCSLLTVNQQLINN